MGGNNIIKGLISALGAGAIAQAINGTSKEIAKTFFEYNQDKSRQEGRLVSGAASAFGVDALMSGRGLEANYFSAERKRALGLAQESLGGLTARGLGGMGASIVAGAGSGAALGLMGGPLAALTSTTGALIGGTVAGLGSLFTGQTGAGLRSMVNGDGFGAGVDRYRQEHLLNNFTQNFEAEKAKNYYKTQALGFFEGNRGDFTRLQQMSGMGDQGILNFMGEGGGLFTTADKKNAMSAIASAGGSTAQMRSATDALRLQRDYGLQSASSLVGTLSSNLGNGQTFVVY